MIAALCIVLGIAAGLAFAVTSAVNRIAQLEQQFSDDLANSPSFRSLMGSSFHDERH